MPVSDGYRWTAASANAPTATIGAMATVHLEGTGGPAFPEGSTVVRIPLWVAGPSAAGQAGSEGQVAMPTTGALIGLPPMEPSNRARPKENTPPSAAANQ